jgi:2,4-dienoyl-CoA reductase-like NADH-dependent reductase (Old Yellow Enzyme family)
MSALFEPFAMRSVTLRHRLVVSPMCMYACAPDGKATDWHLVHYGHLAMGGAAMVMLEATSIDPVGRHSYADLGIWSDEHVAPLRRIADFIKSQDSVPAIQLQHAGRKASARRPWHGGSPLTEEDAALRGEQPWQAVGPSPIPLSEGKPVPTALKLEDLPAIVGMWAAAARRALAAGFEVVEIHAAHGYLLNQFLSPLANQRSDRYGGDLEGRMRLPLEVAEAVRAVWPDDKPVLVRVSCVDGVEGGWTLEETVALSKELKARGVDAIDCSSGGIGGAATMNRLARFPGFQVPFAERVRREAEIPTVAVGLIMTPELAAEIIDSGFADLVAIGREVLVDPNWPNAARTSLQPEAGYAHWRQVAGWWLDKRAAILRS